MLKKNYKLFLGITLLVQAISFVTLFFILYGKKKSIAYVLLTLGSIGGAAGAYLVLKEAKSEMQRREQTALETFSFDDEDGSLGFDEEDCEYCCGDCSECDEAPAVADEVSEAVTSAKETIKEAVKEVKKEVE